MAGTYQLTHTGAQVDNAINAITSINATNVPYTDTTTQLSATNVQSAIEKIASKTGNVGNCIIVDNVLPTLASGKTYEIKGDVTISSTLSIPDDVTFLFNGGSIGGSGTVTLNGAKFVGDVKIGQSLQFSGNLSNDEVVLEWFQGLELNPNSTHTQNATLIERAISIVKPKYIVRFNEIYPIHRAISVNKCVRLYGFEHQDVYAERIWQATCGIYTTQFTNGIEVESGGKLSLYNFQIIGWPQLGHSNSNLYNYPQTVTFSNTFRGNTYSVTVNLTGNGANTRGVNCVAPDSRDREICWIEHSGVCGFVSGIRLYNNYLKAITDTQLASCRWGLWCQYTSDFVLNNVHFNTCHNNYDFSTATADGSSTPTNVRNDAMLSMDTSCALYLSGCGMVQCNNCRFEFNAMSIGLSDYGHGIQFNNCIFDHNANMFIGLYASGKIYNNDEPNFSDILINNCSFMRGCQVGEDGDTTPGLCYFNIKHHGGGASTTNKQKILLNFAGNIFSDRCDLPSHNILNHQPNVFYFNNDTISDAIKIVFACNNLEDTASTSFASWNDPGIGRILISACGNMLPDNITMPGETDGVKYIENNSLYVTTLPPEDERISRVNYYVR